MHFSRVLYCQNYEIGVIQSTKIVIFQVLKILKTYFGMDLRFPMSARNVSISPNSKLILANLTLICF